MSPSLGGEGKGFPLLACFPPRGVGGGTTHAQRGHLSRGELTHGHRRQHFLGWSLLGLWVTDTNNTQGKSLVLHLDVAFTGFFLRPDLFPCRECSSCDHTRASSCACPHTLCVSPLGENRSPASLDPQRHPSTRELCPSASCFNPPKS